MSYIARIDKSIFFIKNYSKKLAFISIYILYLQYIRNLNIIIL